MGNLGMEMLNNRGDNSNEMGDNLPYVDVGGTVVQLELGQSHTCALLDNGKVKCWGLNDEGQLGYGDTNNRGDNSNEMGDNLPYVDVGGTVVQLELGESHACALLDNGKVKCWGLNDEGQLGYGDTNNRGDNPDEMGADLTLVFTICPLMCSTCAVQDVCSSCHYPTYVKNGTCTKWSDCNPGYHIVSQSNGTHDRLCKACRPTFFTSKKNEHVCSSWKTCREGEFRLNGSTSEDATCNNCMAGTFSDKSTSIACKPCPTGTFSKEYAFSCTSWRNCPAGRHISREGTDSKDRACSACQKGKFTSANSLSVCTIWRTCSRGEFISQEGTAASDRTCKICDRGRYANGSKCMDCPHGSYCADGVRTQCPLGRYGKFLVADHAVMEAACEMCPTGKYGVIQDPNEGKACLNCPSGRYNNQPGLAKTSDLKDYCPDGCPAGQYLDGKRCITCPDGGYCPGGTGISGVTAITGYWRVPNTTSFIPCLNPCSCLGSINPSSTCPEAKVHHSEGCNIQKGYQQGSRLCAGCRSGYSRDGRGTCKKCDNTVNVMVLILGIIAILFLPGIPSMVYCC